MKFEGLTKAQKAYICNGCGGKGGVIRPPKGIFFRASCDNHDYGFWKGGGFRAMMRCNSRFLSKMFRDIKSLPFWKRPYYRAWALSYYAGITACGWGYFNFTDTPRNVNDYDWQRVFALYSPDEIIPWELCLR